MSSGARSVEGQGLHGGRPSRVSFLRDEGPIRLRTDEGEAPIDALTVTSTARATTVAGAGGRLRIGTVEHLFAALAGLGVRRGLVVAVEGDEIPLADGGAAAFMDALAALDLTPEAPPLEVVREGVIEVGRSRFELSPDQGVRVEVEIDFGDPRLAPTASWDGDAGDFRERIAVARTFGFAREVEQLLARGLASHVLPESVVVLTDDGVLSSGRPFHFDEPARHKLLDLVGDLYAYGGPPRGRVKAIRPGHAATHAAVARALDVGLLATARKGESGRSTRPAG